MMLTIIFSIQMAQVSINIMQYGTNVSCPALCRHTDLWDLQVFWLQPHCFDASDVSRKSRDSTMTTIFAMIILQGKKSCPFLCHKFREIEVNLERQGSSGT